MRSARAVGDLGNPFYAEERQRDVWNEASAVGLQLAIWLMLLAATVMVWVGGRDAVPYALALLVLLAIGTVRALGHVSTSTGAGAAVGAAVAAAALTLAKRRRSAGPTSLDD